jgi:hypothetical protein
VIVLIFGWFGDRLLPGSLASCTQRLWTHPTLLVDKAFLIDSQDGASRLECRRFFPAEEKGAWHEFSSFTGLLMLPGLYVRN